jgi:sugar lactone lactonase YvrE
MVKSIDAELWQPAGALLGEGPSWDARSQVLSWVDVLSGTVHVSDAQGRPVAEHHLPGHVGAALPSAAGGWLVALPDRLAYLAPDGALTDYVALEPDLPGNRANDAKCDPSGRAWVGTMNYSEANPSGSLYRVGPGRSVSAALSGVTIANGLAWSTDATTMYFIDTPAHEVRAYPFELATGALGPAAIAVRVDDEDGLPDGMCSDDEGCLWVALWGGGCVHRYTPAGELDAVVRVPVAYTTSCCFGGPGGDQLFITTAGQPDNGPLRQQAGSLWACRPGVSGPPATPWSG